MEREKRPFLINDSCPPLNPRRNAACTCQTRGARRGLVLASTLGGAFDQLEVVLFGLEGSRELCPSPSRLHDRNQTSHTYTRFLSGRLKTNVQASGFRQKLSLREKSCSSPGAQVEYTSPKLTKGNRPRWRFPIQAPRPRPGALPGASPPGAGKGSTATAGVR